MIKKHQMNKAKTLSQPMLSINNKHNFQGDKKVPPAAHNKYLCHTMEP